MGYKYEEVQYGLPEHQWTDGQLVQVTLFTSKAGLIQPACTFPNYLWSAETIEEAMLLAGFTGIEHQVTKKTSPVVLFSAYKI